MINSIFESMRAYNGRLFKLDEHIDRLFASAKSTGIRIPYSKKKLTGLISGRVLYCRIKDAYVRVSIDGKDIDIIIKKFVPYPVEYYEKGVKIVTAVIKRNFSKGPLPNVKSSNFLWGILAKIEGLSQEPFETLMLNQEGHVTEGSVSNIFVVRDGIVLTLPAYSGILAGITRGVIIELAEKCKLKTLETPITRHDVYNADEVFLTNTSIEVMPVVSVDNRTISDGTPGSVTKKLLNEFRKLVGKL